MLRGVRPGRGGHGRCLSGHVEDGHEVVFHGNRHTSFDGPEYHTGYDYIDAGVAAIEAPVGVRPTGFFVPFTDASHGARWAAAELGIRWLSACPECDVPPDLTLLQPVMPADSNRLQLGRGAGVHHG